MDIAVSAVLDIQERPAVLIDDQYRVVAANFAYHDAYAVEVKDLVGPRCHEVSHHSKVPCHLNGEDCQ